MSAADTKNQKKRKQLLYKFLLFTAILIGVNVLAYRWYAQIDLTQDKRYSTTDATKQMLKDLKGNVNITVYLKNKHLPAAFKHLAISTEELLKTFSSESHNKVVYNFVDPTEDDKAINVLEQYHMSGIPVTINDDGGSQQRMVFPWALVTYNPEDGAAPRSLPVLLQESNSMVLSKTILMRSEVLLEYNLGNTIFQLQKNQPDFVAYVLGNGEAVPPQINSLLSSVNQARFAMDTLSLQSVVSIPNKYKAIIINRPSVPFSEIDLFKIDQYVMNGGRLMLAMDATNASIDSFQTTETFTANQNDLGINNLLFPYGARINSDLVLDASSNAGIPVATDGKAQSQMFPWPYYPVLEGNDTVPMTKNLEGVLARFPASVDLNRNNDEKVRKTALLSTSIYGKTIGLPAIVMYKSVLDEPNLATFNKKNVIVAALLEGQFLSPFMQQQSADLQSFIAQNNIVLKNQSTAGNKIIIIADGDILLNEVKQNGASTDMGFYRFAQNFKFDNASFFQNALTYLVDDKNLLQARAKTFENRILDPERTKAEESKWQMLAIVLPVVLVGILALLYTYLRKRKYAKK